MTTRSVDVAVIGAGPYGLSLAAHLRSHAIDFRIFGEPMGAWKNNMPQGMLLKSYPWATNLSDAESWFTVKQFCGERELPYSDTLIALPVETFISYGETFQARFAPAVERRSLVSLEPTESGIWASFADGETVFARRVIIAVGLSSFKHMPPLADHLPSEVVSHSGDYGALDVLDGKEVIVVGSGSSATDFCALLHERGISVTLVARTSKLGFAAAPRSRGMVAKAIAPTSGIGNSWTLAACAYAPWLVHLLPDDLVAALSNAKALGPMGSPFTRDRVVGKIPLLLGRELGEINLRGDRVELQLTTADGQHETARADHVIFATGYRVDVGQLPFLGSDIKTRMRLVGGSPRLTSHYESSIPGLHFVGPASANSFGPVCRFVAGASHSSRHLARYLPMVLGRRPTQVIDTMPIGSEALQ